MAPTLAQMEIIASLRGPGSGNGMDIDAVLNSASTISGGIFGPGIVAPGIGAGSTGAGSSTLPKITTTLKSAIVESVRPRAGGRSQKIGRPVIAIAGTEVPLYQLAGGVTFTERVDGARTLSFQVPVRSSEILDQVGPTLNKYSNPFDDPSGGNWVNRWRGAPPGKDEIELDWVVPSTDDMHLIPMLREGVVDNSSIRHESSGDVWDINVVGKEQRLDRQLVNLEIPPGHGLTLGQMIQRILENLPKDVVIGDIPEFVPAGSCNLEGPRYKEVVLNDRSGWQVANEILALFHQRLSVDRDGSLKISFLGPNDEREPDWSFKYDDLLEDGNLNIQAANDGPTSIRVTASEQIVSDDDSGGVTISVTTINIDGQYQIKVPAEKISDTSGNLTASGLSPSPDRFQRISHTRITRTTRQDQPISERVVVHGWRQRERSAGDLLSDGTVSWNVGRYIQDGSRGVEGQERWQRISEEYNTWSYRSVDDFESSVSIAGEPLVLRFTRQFKNGWHFRKRALGAIGTTGAITYNTSTNLTWGNQGVDGSFEDYVTLERNTVTFRVTKELFVDRETSWFGFWHIDKGNFYVYSTGENSRSLLEAMPGTAERVETKTYIPGSKSSHRIIETITDQTGVIVEIKTTTGSGFLPSASILEGSPPDPNLYPDGKFTSRTDTEEFEVFCESVLLAATRQPYTEEVSSPFIENESEAQCWCFVLMREKSALSANFSLPLNPLVQPGQKIYLDMGQRAGAIMSTYDVYVTEVTHSLDFDNGTGRTDVQGNVFVI